MLAVSALRKDENKVGEMEGFGCISSEDFPDFGDGTLLDVSIDFDDLFVGIHDGDVLPDLEMDPAEILAADLPPAASGGTEESEDMNASMEELSVEKTTTDVEENNNYNHNNTNDDERRKVVEEQEVEKQVSGSGSSGLGSSSSSKGEEIVSKRDQLQVSAVKAPSKDGGADKGRKSSSTSSATAQAKNNNNNNNQGKRKVKVDWTPELHRRFVQAVEQLGVDKAVPSRILELMGIDCLTRHNIASHLQKYRSHRKHLLAREAEAATWSHRRQMYGAAAPVGGGKRDMNPWLAPTMGFPPMSPMHPHPPPHPHHHHHHFRPLHVWGHPTVDQSLVQLWPKHLPHTPSPPPPPPPSWGPPPADPSYWHHHPQRVPNGLTPGTPCFPPPMAPTRFGAPPVPGIPPPHHGAMYKADPASVGAPAGQSLPHPLIDFQPSKESIDAAIGDVLSKPWLPLPLGLKPPSTDSVLGELQRQGVPKIPPSCA